MCVPVLARNAGAVDVALYEVRVREAQLADATLHRHRDKVIDPVVDDTAAALRLVFRAEEKRVLELLSMVKLRKATEQGAGDWNVDRTTIYDPETLALLLAAGISVTAYEAILEQTYLAVFPGAMKAAVSDVAWEIGRRPAWVIGAPRFSGVATWMRDHSIRFSRTWAPGITETTNKMIRNQLIQGMRAGEGTDQLAQRIRNVYAESAKTVKGNVPGLAIQDRAELIARTESSRGYGAARIESGIKLGLSEKEWVLSGTPYSYVDVCMENANQGRIPVNEPFVSGDQAEPAHPNCLCGTRLIVPDGWELPEGLMAA